jgi:ABC-type transport system involved in multi-copper enzyme maturation permease subunit
MKYLAILKDSLREAIDTKVFYVMVGLSLVVILCVASVSFRPEPAELGSQAILERFFNGAILDPNRQPRVQYEIKDFHQLDEHARPWASPYQFLIVARDAPNAPKAFRSLVVLSAMLDKEGEEDHGPGARLRKMRAEMRAQVADPEKFKEFLQEIEREVDRVTNAQMEQFIKGQLTTFGTWAATRVQVESAGGGEVQFLVEAKPRAETIRTWPHQLVLFFGAVPTPVKMSVGDMVYFIESSIVGSLGAGIAMLIATIVTAFFIPNMLRKGTIDLLLAKPLRRTTLLVYKYIGGLSFMFLNTLIVVLGVWLAMGLRSTLWGTGFLVVVLILTFEFAIFYAISTLFGVLTRSPIVAILMTCVAWLVLYLVGSLHTFVELTRDANFLPKWVCVASDAAHYVLPRYKDLDMVSANLVARDLLGPGTPDRKLLEDMSNSISWAQTFGVSAAYIAVFLGLACLRFATKDY